MLARRQAMIVASVAVAAIYGCDGPTQPTAQFDNFETDAVVYAMNGSSILLPSALAVRFGTVVRADANFSFDIAFDLNASNEVVVYTQPRVATQLVNPRRVGLLTTTATYTQVDRAPVSGYVYDSLVTLPVGTTLLVDVLESACGGSFFGPNIRAKIVVDSVFPATRAIWLSLLSNPNCGFRSLVQGQPKD